MSGGANIRERLFALGDERYAGFKSALIPNIPKETVIGVRMPMMRKLAKEIAELRKPKPMIVKLEPEEARLALSKGSMVWATVGRKRERCWLTKAKEMYIGNIPARLAGAAEYETEIYFAEE